MRSSRNTFNTGIASVAATPPTPLPLHCELCGGPVRPGPYTLEVFDASDVYACDTCIEEMMDARADEPRCEVGMVGGRG
jgi:hypothetical protein